MFRRCAVALITALIVLPVAAFVPSPDAHATSPGANGKIAFTSNLDGRTEVYTVNTDGTGATELTDSAGAADPSWSPDGSALAYAGGPDPAGIYTVGPNGGAPHRVTDGSFMTAWSGDGSRIAFVAGVGSSPHVFTVNVDGSNRQDIVADALDPAWSPDGTKIVYRGSDGIYVVGSDGANPKRLTTGSEGHPSFSPDGTKIAFESAGGTDGGQIWVMNADGSNPVQVTHGSPQKRNPAWSPDGNALVAQTFDNGSYQIAIVDADGSHLHTIVSNMGFVDVPDWQPIPQPKPPFNGKLLFTRGDSTTLGLYTANPDGSDLTNISAEPELAGVWSPDGLRIAYLGRDNGIFALLVRNADGTNPHVVAEPPLLDRFPAAWSPDGTKLAFMVKQSADGGDDIWTVNADGTGATAIIADPSFDLFPTWTSDGRLVYTRGQIVIANADGSNETPLTSPPDGITDSEPTVSPDGSHILFRRVENPSSSSEAWIMNTDGTGQAKLATLAPDEAWMRYSPDGKQIVLTRDTYANQSAIVVMNADGSGAHDVYASSADLAYPSWAPLNEPVVPGVPSAPTAAAGDGWARVSWTPPLYDGGDPVDRYTVTASPGGASVSVPASQTWATVPGLTNGTSYAFTVRALTTAGAGPSSAQSTAVTPIAKFNGKIAFSRTVGSVPQIFTTNPDGSGVTQITNYPGGAGFPSWSPDGAQLAIDGGPDPQGVYVINADGTNPRKVSDSPALFVAWSPDGSKLAYTRPGTAPNTIDIATVNVDGTNERHLGTGVAPAWTPDSQRIVFRNRDGQVWVMNADGSGRTLLSAEGGSAPGVSPDGTKVVVAASDGIRVMGIDGTNPTVINPDSNSEWARWSSDGHQIVYQTASSTPSHLAVMNSDGSGVREITTGQVDDGLPDWQPLAQPGIPSSPTAVVASAGDSSAVVHWTSPASAGAGSVTGYTVTSSPGGRTAAVAAPATQATVSGLTNGTAYTFTVHATNAYGDSAESAQSNSVSPRPGSRGGFILDDWGGIHPFHTGSFVPPAITVPGPYWPGQDVVRGIASAGGGGYVVDDWGGIHPYTTLGGGVGPTHDGPYWPGLDVVRGIALLPDGTGGYVLDDWGGLHSFGVGIHPAPPAPQGGPYWAGVDAARGLTILPDGSGGYVVDAWGGLHPFVIPGSGHTMPAQPTNGPYWPGLDVVRGVAADAEGNGGYVLDDWGGIHSFSIPGKPGPVPAPSGGPYWAGQDVTRGISVVP